MEGTVRRCATVVSTVQRPSLSSGHLLRDLLAPVRKQYASGPARCIAGTLYSGLLGRE